MNRIKALYRSWAFPVQAQASTLHVIAPSGWPNSLNREFGGRAERLYQQLDVLQSVRQQARHDLLIESHKHSAVKLLRQIPSIRPDSRRSAGGIGGFCENIIRTELF